MKWLNNEIRYYVISSVIFTVVLILLVFSITKYYINSNIHNVYIDNGVVIDYDPKVSYELEKLSDIDGLKVDGNKINLTNNGSDVHFKVLLSPVKDDYSEIRYMINSSFISTLGYLDKEDNKYIIYEGDLKSGYSIFLKVSLWLSENSELDIKNSFRFSVVIENKEQ